MNYFERPEVSNSDLTNLKKYWMPSTQVADIESAYRFGSLLDAIITEPHRVDFTNLRVDGVQYKADEFEKAVAMKRAFLADEFCRHILKTSQMQHITVNPNFRIEYSGHVFRLPARCKWDFFGGDNALVDADLKSTATTTEKAFIQSIDYFDYDRQSAWYMDLENRSRFLFIGVSKINRKVFKYAVKRGDPVYQRGRAKYQELAFKYWYLFGNLETYESSIEPICDQTNWAESF